MGHSKSTCIVCPQASESIGTFNENDKADPRIEEGERLDNQGYNGSVLHPTATKTEYPPFPLLDLRTLLSCLPEDIYILIHIHTLYRHLDIEQKLLRSLESRYLCCHFSHSREWNFICDNFKA